MALTAVRAALDFIGLNGALAVAILLIVIAWQGRHIMMVARSIGLYMKLALIGTVVAAVAIAVGVLDPSAIHPEPLWNILGELMDVVQ